jgi:hypothetical protein
MEETSRCETGGWGDRVGKVGGRVIEDVEMGDGVMDRKESSRGPSIMLGVGVALGVEFKEVANLEAIGGRRSDSLSKEGVAVGSGGGTSSCKSGLDFFCPKPKNLDFFPLDDEDRYPESVS